MQWMAEFVYVVGLEEQLRLCRKAKRLVLDDYHLVVRRSHDAKQALRSSKPWRALAILEGRANDYLGPELVPSG